MLTIIDGQITNARIGTGTGAIEPARVIAYYTDLGFRPAIAMAVSTGALVRRLTTIALARQAGLITTDPIIDARAAGLIQ